MSLPSIFSLSPLIFIQRVVFLCLILICPHLTTGQSEVYNIERITVDDGLSDRGSSCMIKDARGLLWIGTSNGLNRYDGYNFEVYSTNPKSGNHINSNSVAELIEDRWKRILVMYKTVNQNAGMNYILMDALDPDTGENELLSLNDSMGLSGKVVDHFVDDRDQFHLVTISGKGMGIYGLDSLSKFNEVVFLSNSKLKMSANAQYKVFKDHSNQFWVYNSVEGVKVFNLQSELKAQYPNLPFNKNGKLENVPVNIFETDAQHRIWIASGESPGLYQFSTSQNQFVLDSLFPKNHVYNKLYHDEKGNVLADVRSYFARIDQLYCLNVENELINFDYLLKPGNLIGNIYSEDFFDIVYFCTYEGVEKIKNSKRVIDTYLDTIPGSWGKFIMGITGDGKEEIYFIRTISNWYKMNESTEEITPLYIKDEGRIMDIYGSVQGIYDDGILWGDNFDTLKRTGHLIKYNISNDSSILYDVPSRIQAMELDKTGQLWLGIGNTGNSKLMSFDPISETFVEYAERENNDPFKGMYFRVLYESSDGYLWAGMDKALIKIDPISRQSFVYKLRPGNPNSFSSAFIVFIDEDPEGRLLLGTSGGGVNIFNPSTGEVEEVLDVAQGLCSNMVCNIIQDSLGNYWISTFNGMSYYDRTNGTFRNFYMKDGLTHNEFNRRAYYQSASGKIYYGTLNGVNAFYSNDLLKARPNPPVTLTKISTYDSDQNKLQTIKSGLQDINELVLKPSISYFELFFTLPNYEDPKKNQYSVWLEGYDDEYNYLGNTPYVRFNKLPAGRYTVHVKAADGLGNWSASEVILPLVVQQVFYKKTWFFAMVSALIVGIMYLVYLYRVRQLLKVERLRTRIASDLHDEVGSMLTRISMGSDMLKEGVYQGVEQKQELDKIADQSRKATSIMRDVIWSIDSRKDKVKNLVDHMNEFLAEMLGLAEIRYDLETNNLPMEKSMEVDVRQNMYFIFKEAINNIVKHSNATNVKVKLLKEDRYYLLKVSDNGSDFIQKEESYSGQGTKNMLMRAQRIDAELKSYFENGFHVELKMSRF